MNSILMVGAFIETIELCEKCGFKIEGIFNQDEKDSYYGYPILGTDNDLVAMKDKYQKTPLVIVPDAPAVRERLYWFYRKEGFCIQTVISPDAMISKSATIGEGSIIQDFCNISAYVQIGRCVRVNSCANIMHESVVGDFSAIAPNAVILGRCSISSKAYIGANATILPGHTIGKGALIGAAAVITKNVADGKVMIGNPAHPMKE